MVTLTSDITIGKFRFSGVHECKIKRSMHSYMDTASITIPSIATIKKNGQTQVSDIITGKQFLDGDPVSIKLGYDGNLVTEFEGFVKRRDLNMPLTVELEGYCRQLRLNNSVTGNFKKTTAKDLLELAVKNTDIKVECPDDIPLSGIRLVEASGADICDYIKKATEGCVSIFFKTPKLLWCGLYYTASTDGNDILKLGDIKARLGWNVIKDNDLKERVPKELVQVILHGKLATGQKIFTASQLKSAKAKLKRIVTHLPSEAILTKLAQEKEYRENYTGYEGSINAFLEPVCWPGWMAYITDDRYKEKAGTYIIESTEVTFGMNGARRKIELGPQLSHKS